MANIRTLKKNINYLTFDLLSECFTYQSFHPEIKPEVVNKIAVEVLNNRNDLIERINNIEGKENYKLIKSHFQKIRQDFEKSIKALEKLEQK